MSQPAASQSPPAPPAPSKPAGVLKERWTQWVALTTTILAVSAAISSLKGGSYSTRVQLATTRENDAWAQYQSKSIKENLLVVEKSLLDVQALEARSPEAREAIAKQVAKLQADIDRYEKEKGELKVKAEAIAADEVRYQQIGGNFGLAVMLLQIAIMLSSVAALLKKPLMWVAGLAFGVAGLAYLSNGFFGWF